MKKDNIIISQTDITTLQVDAIVNAANRTLLGGGGVDGAIHRVAGNKLFEACKKIRITKYPNGLPTGEAVITKGFNLPSDYVIHAVGPIWRGGKNNEEELLANCYVNSMNLVREYSIRTIAFSSISTGAYNFPIPLATGIALREILNYLRQTNIDFIVTIAAYGHKAYYEYINQLEKM